MSNGNRRIVFPCQWWCFDRYSSRLSKHDEHLWCIVEREIKYYLVIKQMNWTALLMAFKLKLYEFSYSKLLFSSLFYLSCKSLMVQPQNAFFKIKAVYFRCPPRSQFVWKSIDRVMRIWIFILKVDGLVNHVAEWYFCCCHSCFVFAATYFSTLK